MLKMHILEILLELAKLLPMKNNIIIKDIIKPYNKILEIEGDKSLSIRWALLASQAIGKSKSINLLKSEDVLNTL